ncbi:glutathione hydrolase 7 [Petromyzon marinus]|uniref:Glutathione hydrolase n=1 Tax=Petromyzon marinus TaxID=7757 RepID=A0AAJ7TIY8_PETMA|nr:glutathione hydrolase 7 [Petromyzon marinus]XP_032817728.1 glutathione hydrolase 7 [Petromyzon marinus]XP_032817729.1 glutathione hydrolase 7 [Petromyzon marinus]
MADDTGPDANLGAFSPVDYMSITSFPRLPEDDAASSDTGGVRARRKQDDALDDPDSNDPENFLKTARLQRLPSSSSEPDSQESSPLRLTKKDPFSQECACRRDGLTVIITACLTFATGVTIALIIQIYLGEPQVYYNGTVVSDVRLCSDIGTDILHKRGSSVDAAVATALCAGIVHPHSSGLGGGGVMLVHNIKENTTRAIDFWAVAPAEDLLFNNLNANLTAGLSVGVPGMIKGLYQAHQLYGRMPWGEVVAAAARVAKDGFNVTTELASAVGHLLSGNLSASLRGVFAPGGQGVLAGDPMKRLDLANVLDAIALHGPDAVYQSNLTLELIAQVAANGGVLSAEDFSNYSVLVQNPLETTYQGHLLLSAPPPHAGASLLLALGIMEGYNLSTHDDGNLTYHWLTEALKFSFIQGSTLGDPTVDASVAERMQNILSKLEAGRIRELINDTWTLPADSYGARQLIDSYGDASSVLVMGPDDLIVAMTSSLSGAFGSRVMTPSGILLNSAMLDFTDPSQSPNPTAGQANVMGPGRRPITWALPTIARPLRGLCGTYLSLGGSKGPADTSSLAQIIIDLFSFRRNVTDSVLLARLHPEPNLWRVLVEDGFPEAEASFLRSRGHNVVRSGGSLGVTHVVRRLNDNIRGVEDPRAGRALP